jgi:hypothetical protein
VGSLGGNELIGEGGLGEEDDEEEKKEGSHPEGPEETSWRLRVKERGGGGER